jgi:hypothetical protein
MGKVLDEGDFIIPSPVFTIIKRTQHLSPINGRWNHLDICSVDVVRIMPCAFSASALQALSDSVLCEPGKQLPTLYFPFVPSHI